MKRNHRPTYGLRGLLPLLLGAIICSFTLLACEEEENNDTKKDPNTPTTPTTPVNPGDWTDVPIAGVTINKGDISISFPAGTFTTASKVAVTEVKASNITKGAISKFYQVKLQGNSLKEFDVTVKCNSSENTRMVVQTEGFCIHEATSGKFVCPMETQIGTGSATATIPVLAGADGQYPEFVVGAADMAVAEDNSSAGANNGKMMMPRLFEKGVKVSWPGHTDEQSKKVVELIKQKAEIANQQLVALGFDRPGGKVPYVLEQYGESTWGDHVQSKWSDQLNYIRLNEARFKNILTVNENDMNDCEQTLVHETSHYYDSQLYDTRTAFTKNSLGLLGDEWAMFSEAVGSWVEKAAGSKRIGLNSTNNARIFLESFYPVNLEKDWQNVGYGMSLFLEHMAKKKGDNEIVKMMQYHRNGLSVMPNPDSALRLDQAYLLWFKNHDVDLHDYTAYKNFIFDVVSGKFDSRTNYSFIGETKIIASEDPVRYQEDIHPLGCTVKYIRFNQKEFVDAKGNKSMADKQFNITQNGEDGVISDVFLIDSKGQSKWYSFAEKDVPCSFDINDYRGLYIVTTCTSKTKACRGDLTLQVGDRALLKLEPEELTFGPEGGMQELHVTTDQPRFAVRSNTEWLEVAARDGGVIEVTCKANNSGQQREGSLTVYARDNNSINLAQRDVKVTQTGTSQIQACSVVFEYYYDYEEITDINQTEPKKGTSKELKYFNFDQYDVTYTGTGVTVHGHWENERYKQDIDVVIPYLTGEVSSINFKQVLAWVDNRGDKTKYESYETITYTAKNLNNTSNLWWASKSYDDANFDLDYQRTYESWFTNLETGNKFSYRHTTNTINKSKEFRAIFCLDHEIY